MKLTELKKTAKIVGIEFIKFVKPNCLYMIWFVLYFTIAWYILGADLHSFTFVLVIYGGSVAIALSPMGEYVLRLIKNYRRPSTQQEKEYLLPLFEEVLENAKQIDPKLSDNISILIMDDMFVNSLAAGRRTIAVTRGAIATFTADELKGILAHELGHISHGHTKAVMLTTVGNLLFTGLVWLLKMIFVIAELILRMVERFQIVFTILKFVTIFIRFMIDLSMIIFVHLSEIILALNSRANDIQADKFAYEVGYGKELISGLYVLQKISINAKTTLLDRIKAPHPHVSIRLEHLENLENGETPEQ